MFDSVEIIVRKGEKAGYQHFLLFLQCLHKPFLRVVKTCYKAIKVLSKSLLNIQKNAGNFSHTVFFDKSKTLSLVELFPLLFIRLQNFRRRYLESIWPFTTESRLLMTLYEKPFENIVGKEKMLVTSIFSFSHNVFHPSYNKFWLFGHIYLVDC